MPRWSRAPNNTARSTLMRVREGAASIFNTARISSTARINTTARINSTARMNLIGQKLEEAQVWVDDGHDRLVNLFI